MVNVSHDRSETRRGLLVKSAALPVADKIARALARIGANPARAPRFIQLAQTRGVGNGIFDKLAKRQFGFLGLRKSIDPIKALGDGVRGMSLPTRMDVSDGIRALNNHPVAGSFSKDQMLNLAGIGSMMSGNPVKGDGLKQLRELVPLNLMQGKTASCHSIKSAGPVGDMAGDILPSMVPGASVVYAPANSVGHLAGLIDDAPESTPSSPGLAFVPGIGGYRVGQRIKKTVSESNKAKRRGTLNAVSEYIGGGTSSLLSGILGAGIGAGVGALKGKGHIAGGAGIGAAAGVGAGAAASLVGALLAAVTKRRSKQEQIDNDTTDSAVRNILVPGSAAYNHYKRYGSSANYDKQTDRTETITRK